MGSAGIPPLVDREAELTALESMALRGSQLPVYIYGPEGCGKTRLLRELARRLGGRGGFVVVYVDALREDARSALQVGGADVAVELLEAIASRFGGGGGLARRIGALVRELAKRTLLKDRRVVLLLDDIARSLGLERIEAYVKSLESLALELLEVYGAASVLMVATTSEGVSLEKLSRHTYADVRLLWNLAPDAARSLAGLLGADGEAVDYAVDYAGGNPREIIELGIRYRWNLEAWLSERIEPRLHHPVRRLLEMGLKRELQLLAEDPDILWLKPSPQLTRAYRLLVRWNLMAYKGYPTLAGGKLPPNPQHGIGEHYAWQLPAYPKQVRRMLQG